MSLLYGVAVLILVWWLAKLFAGANPKVLARLAKTGGGVAALGVAGLLMVRGRMDMAIFLGGVGAWLLGWSATGPGGIRFPWADRSGPTPGATSKVKSALLEMELDHDSGAMAGTVTSGPYAGRALDSLDMAELAALMRDCLTRDPDGARLLEAYLDRRTPGWREDAQRDDDAGQRGAPGA
ncbi:MAG: molecular chaperone DnaJ, partial [Proteobacteria bacterium]|nr:molecular chaperone DnaJ [Pseudomonadota bacterium]